MNYRVPTRDLCEDLRNQRDNDLGDSENVCTASNRQLRLYVAAWMLQTEDSKQGIHDACVRAVRLYEGCGRDLLNRPGHLTTALIACEVAQICAATEAAE